MRPKVFDCRRIATFDVAEQILCLILELVEIGADWKVAGRHVESPDSLENVCDAINFQARL